MQLRHLRYFVKIVEAGSFSRAAATIHVAQPALSQQIAELEEQLGLSLLQRSARGVCPTVAGEILYREASSILRQMERLPGIVRSAGGETEGTVALGMSSTLAPSVAGPFIETCKAALPKVTIKFAVSNSDAIRARVEAQTLDIALVFEDELVASFSRKPLFRQRLYFITREPLPDKSLSLGRLAKLPLILPIQPNVMRTVIDRALTAAGIAPNITAEADAISSVLSAVRTGVGNAIIATGNLADVFGDDLPPPLLVEPPLYLTASIIWSSDFPLTHAGEAVRNVLAQYVERYLREHRPPGVRWIGSKTAISTADTPISK